MSGIDIVGTFFCFFILTSMQYKKYLALALILSSLGGSLGTLSIVRADDFSDMKTALNQSIASLIARYDARIQALETENAALKSQIASLANTGATVATPVVVAPVVAVAKPVVAYTGSDISARVIDKINTNLASILSENSLDASGVIGLFEFIEPNAVFISIDDGKNPTGVTAFKIKILYTFDQNLTFTKIGLFDLNYEVQMYKTVFGSNPYAKSTRKRIQNPLYKGKLFDVVATTTSTGTTIKPSSGTTSVTPVADVTFAQIKAAYDKNKLLDAIKLSDSYIARNPNDIETLKIRYRSYYIVGKYAESLAEVKKIETTTGASFDKTIACDAAVIAKISKKTDVSTYYSAICKKK